MLVVKEEPKCEEDDFGGNLSWPGIGGNGSLGERSKNNNNIKRVLCGARNKRFIRYQLAPSLQKRTLFSNNRRMLLAILGRLTKARRWKEACGVLSVLLQGIPRGTLMARYQKIFLTAMELQRQFKEANYDKKIKKLLEIWMEKRSQETKDPMKKQSVYLELALFYMAQNNVEDAYRTTKLLVQSNSKVVPIVNLVHGLLSYQLWYSQIRKDDSNFQKLVQIDDTTYDECWEAQPVESPSGHCAEDINDDISVYSSGSSVCYDKVSNFVAHVQVLGSMEGSAEIDFLRNSNCDDTFINTSNFLMKGMDSSLLPSRLKRFDSDLKESIFLKSTIENDKYKEAVRHLWGALSSTPPLLEALQPLIQILLLGDQVKDAFTVLEQFCHDSDTALPLRLRARLLECFGSKNQSVISSCYENVLKINPTCSYSLERLIHLHKNGSYSSNILLEMFALHLDNVDGSTSTWAEFASFFLKLLDSMDLECQDCVSVKGSSMSGTIPLNGIPPVFSVGRTRDAWRLRCTWWETRHFSRSISAAEGRAGDWKRLASKAACASHLYGPNFEYTVSALDTLSEEGEDDEASLLSKHLQNPLKLQEKLNS